MDLLHPGLSIAAHIIRERERAAKNNMLNNNGWRLGHGKQPKKQPKKTPKSVTPLKLTSDSPTAEESGERRRQPSWLKARSASRPETPVSGIPPTPAVEDTGKLSWYNWVLLLI
jgi:hypothetical protein